MWKTHLWTYLRIHDDSWNVFYMKVVALARAVPTVCLDMNLLSVEHIYGRIFVEIFLIFVVLSVS